MMKRETIAIADIYVPIKRRATLEQKRVDEIAASILDKVLQSPILVRVDGAFIRKSSKRVHMAAAAPRGHDRVPLHAADFCTSLLIVD